MRTYQFLGTLLLLTIFLIGLLVGINNKDVKTENCPSITDKLGWNITAESLLLPIVENQKWGFIDSTGKVVIQPQFARVDRFAEGLAPFGDRASGKWGFIDTKGQVIIEPRFANAYPFSGGRATVKIGEQYGFIDHDGREMRGQFKRVTGFREGRAFGQGEDFQWRMIDLNGKLVSDSLFSYVGNFSEGLAAFSGRDNSKQRGFVDRKGNTVIDIHDAHPNFEEFGFSGGLASVYIRSPAYWYHLLNPLSWGKKRWGVIDTLGKQIVSFRYENIQDFSECLASVKINSKYGAINTRGRVVIKPQFDFVNSFSEGLASVKVNEKYGYIDKVGKIVIPSQFQQANLFHEGLAAIQTTNGKRGYIDQTGKIVIATTYDVARAFKGGIATVTANNQWGYIDRRGQTIWWSRDRLEGELPSY